MYRVAVIGCGGISSRHLKGFGEHPECELVAVADIRRDNAEARAAEFGIPAIYTNYRQLLDQQRPDIVSINSWPGTHAEITISAAEHGARGVLCEKPITRSLSELDAMLAAGDASATRIAVGHHLRFDRRNVTARRLIAAGAVGHPLLLRSASEGGLLNNGSHGIDRMRFLLGDPKAQWVLGNVERRTDRYERGEPCEDCCGGIIAFDGGTRGVVESDLPRAGAPGAYLVCGTEGMIRIGDTLEVLDSSGWRAAELEATAGQHAEFIAWLNGESDCRSDAHDNRHTVEIEMALYESARLRQLIPLPLDSGPSPLARMIEEGDLVVEKPGKYDIRAR